MRIKAWSLPNLKEAHKSADAGALQGDCGSANQAESVDMSVTIPSVSNVELIFNSVREEAFLKGYEEGLAEGRKAGSEVGISEGRKEGRADGYKEGYQAGFSEGASKLVTVGESLTIAIERIQAIPDLVKEELVELAYLIASRLSGGTTVSRVAIQQAVVDVLGRLPLGTEKFSIRVPIQDVAAWEAVLNESTEGAAPTLLGDSTLTSGVALVEVGGVCVDIGIEARRALVRSFLGLKIPY